MAGRPPLRVLSILGGFASTQDAHSVELADGRRFYPEDDRQALHRRLLRESLKGARRAKRAEALFLAGGPGGGKSTLLDSIATPPSAVHIDPDRFKTAVPEYVALIEAGEREWAARVVHEESSDLARELLGRAIERCLPVIVDGTGDAAPGKFVEKLQRLHNAGYAVRVIYADAPVEVALQRNRRRAEMTGREVPEQELRDLHREVSARFPEVEALEWLEELAVYDTDVPEGEPAILVAQRLTGSDMDVAAPTTLDEFRRKASA